MLLTFACSQSSPWVLGHYNQQQQQQETQLGDATNMPVAGLGREKGEEQE